MGRTWPVIGRQPELVQLEQLLAAAGQGRGACALLAGEAGIGKTTLLKAFAELAPGRFVIGRCPGPGETPPFGPWLEAVGQLGDLAAADPAGLPAPFGGGAGHSNSYALASMLAGHLSTLKAPAVIALEDIHWADAASLEILRHLTPRLERLPLVIAATYRNDEIDRSHPLWTLLPALRRAGAAELHLRPLSAADVRELTRLALPQTADLDAQAARLHRRTGGHSLFVAELLSAAMRDGSLPADGTPLPETLQQVIDARLLRLSDAGRLVLTAAAVTGEHFVLKSLAATCRLTDLETAAHLERAVDARLVRGLDGEGERFAFTHALVREALVGRLLGPHRRLWHQRVADALLAVAEADVETLAFHLCRAGDPRATGYLLAAGDRALQLGALVQAAAHYRTGLERLAPDSPVRAEFLLRLGHTLGRTPMAFPDMETARPYWLEAACAAESAGDTIIASWSRHFLALNALGSGDPQVLELLEKVQAEQESFLADERFQALSKLLVTASPSLAPIIGFRIYALGLAGRCDEAEALLRVTRADRYYPKGSQAQLEAIPAYMLGRVDEALDFLKRAVEYRLRTHNYTFALSYEVNRLMLSLLHRADRPDEVDAIADGVRALETDTRERSGYGLLPDGYSLLGVYQFLRGDWEAAAHNLVACLRACPGNGPRWRWLHCFAGELLLATGDLEAAAEIVERLHPAEPDAEPLLDLVQVTVHTMKARLRLDRGDLEGARAWLSAADRVIGRRTLMPYRAGVHLGWAQLRRAEGSHAEARAECRKAMAAAQACHHLLDLIRAHRLLGELLAASEETAESGRHLVTALQLAQLCRFPHEEALCRRLLAGTAEIQGPPPERSARMSGLPDGLTAREAEVLGMIAQGLRNKEIARQLYISARTVDGHVRNIFDKLGLRTRSALAAYAARHGLM